MSKLIVQLRISLSDEIEKVNKDKESIDGLSKLERFGLLKFENNIIILSNIFLETYITACNTFDKYEKSYDEIYDGTDDETEKKISKITLRIFVLLNRDNADDIENAYSVLFAIVTQLYSCHKNDFFQNILDLDANIKRDTVSDIQR